MPFPKLIGITGKAGAGKDTIAERLMAVYPYSRVSFAAPIRLALIAMLDLHPSAFQLPHKEEPLPGIGKSPRELMQTLGTEWGRRLVHPDLWLILAKQRINHIWASGRYVVVSDVRFENEAMLIRNMGGVIWHVQRDCAGTPHQHVSEAGIMFDPATDVEISNNDSIEALQAAIAEALI